MKIKGKTKAQLEKYYRLHKDDKHNRKAGYIKNLLNGRLAGSPLRLKREYTS